MKFYTFLMLSILLFTIQSYSQLDHYKSSQININKGLAHNTVEYVFKDSEGFMWFGTHNGLNRFDGTELKTFQHDPNNPYSISGNRILCINEDEQGYLWIGTTSNGVNRMDKKTERFYTYKSNSKQNSLCNNAVNGIKVFEGNSIWLCTNNGIAQYNPDIDAFRTYYPKDHNKNNPFIVYDICKSSSNKIYVASNYNYLHILHPYSGKLEPIHYTRNVQLEGNYRKHIVESPDGDLWISAFMHGLVQYNPKTKKSILFDNETSELPSILLNGNFVIAQNKLWLTTDGAGIITYDLISNKFNTISHDPTAENSLISNKIYSIIVDDQNIIWAATFNQGVNILDPNPIKFRTLKTDLGQEFSLKDKSILAILEDKKGNLWVGTDGDGLYQYDKNRRVSQYLHNPNNINSISTNRIVSLKEDQNENILIGTFNGGFVIFDSDNNEFTNFMPEKSDQSIAAVHVWGIHIDSENRTWLGLLGQGLDQYLPESNSFIHYGPNSNNPKRINHDNVMAIIEDRDSNIWFGTEGKGINILDKESNEMLSTIDSTVNIDLSSNNIKCLYEDSKGIVWIGTTNGGLNKYNKKDQSIQHFGIKDGLPSNIIYSIIEDNKQNLWIGTGYGLSKLNTTNNQFTNYGINDGLMGYICNRNAMYKRNDGTILIGTTHGLNAFNPDNIKPLHYKPKPILTKLRIQNKVVAINDTINGRVVLHESLHSTKKIIITPKDNVFTIDFAALTYTLPRECKFRYMLAGFDKQWIETKAPRLHATYTNLDAGEYSFKVKASNSDDVWNEEEVKLIIKVLPTFWGTIWFKIIIMITFLSVSYALYRRKLALKEMQYLEEKDAQEQKIIHLEKENLESELNNQTFNIINRNRTLVKHKLRLSMLINKVEDKNKAILKEIIQDIDQEINEEKDWKHIEPRLDKVYNNFMTTLKQKHDKLTQNELRIAAYVRMGLSTKEISELLQKTTKAVDNERYRLRKKLAIPQNDSLKNYLLAL